MSELTGQSESLLGPPSRSPSRTLGLARSGVGIFLRQREATVFVVMVGLLLYFGIAYNAGFVNKINTPLLLSEISAPIAIIAVGEVFLLICGEIDLSVGFVYTLAPFIMYYLNVYYHVPAFLAIIGGLLTGLITGWVNGFITVTLRVPSFITTIGTGFVLGGLALTFSHAEPASIPPATVGYGKWIGAGNWTQFIWTVVLVLILHIVLTRTRWGLHTIAVGGNALGAREAGINSGMIKYGNFMLIGTLGALVGMQVAFYNNTIDPLAGGYPPMFYGVIAAVIGGTAMLGGSGTILGAFFGAIVLGTLTDGYDVAGISANPLGIIFGTAIIVAMVVNVQLARLREAGRPV